MPIFYQLSSPIPGRLAYRYVGPVIGAHTGRFGMCVHWRAQLDCIGRAPRRGRHFIGHGVESRRARSSRAQSLFPRRPECYRILRLAMRSVVSIASPNRDVRNHPISEKKKKSATRGEYGRNQAGVSLRSDPHPLEGGSQVVIFYWSPMKEARFLPQALNGGMRGSLDGRQMVMRPPDATDWQLD